VPAALTAARGALRSPALRSAAILAAGGAGFALGNLLLARVLPEREYGAVSLLLSLIQVGAALGSLGLPTLVNRHALAATGQLFRYGVWLALFAALVISTVSLVSYRLPSLVAYVLAATVAAAALGRIAGAVMQSRQRFGTSLLLTQIHNWLLLASVPLVLMTNQRSAAAVLVFILLCYLVTTGVGWRFAAKEQNPAPGSLSLRMLWSEGLSAAGFGLAFNVFLQLDRLVIGQVLSLQDVAAYSLVASLAGSPYRMLQVSAGHTLVPRLRAASSRKTAVGLLRREALLMVGVSVLAAPVLFWLTPWIIGWIAGSAIDNGYMLTAAVIVVGFVRLWQGLAAAVVNAIGTPRELFIMSVLGWVAIGIAVALSIFAGRYGLVAVVFGLGVGWGVIAVGATTLAFTAIARVPHDDSGRRPR
jgi:O-antigen/teichoic acid export membrane protein